MKHTYSLQLIARALFICLVLQNCSGLANLPLGDMAEHNKELDAQAILDKEFTAEGGHLISFYQEQDQLKATVQVNPLDEKDKIYDEVDVVVEKGVELPSLVKLDRKTQQKRIQIKFSEEQKGKPKSVIVHKPWLMGGESEIIVFCGNPGVGKSSLCNSVFQQARFRSGVSARTGMTTEKQEHLHGGKLYIDTPGLADPDKRVPAGKEIEEALKKNSNYKIVFVATLESGRVRPQDVATIETVCEAIKVPFEYGLIFNKVTKGIMDDIIERGLEFYIMKHGPVADINKLDQKFREYIIQMGLEVYLEAFAKKPPYVTTILMKDSEIEDVQNKYFDSTSPNMANLLLFLNKLNSIRIHESDVRTLDVRNYEQKYQDQERENLKIQEELARIQEENRRQVRDLDAQINRLKEETENKGFWKSVGNFLGELGGAIGVGIVKAISERPNPTGPTYGPGSGGPMVL